MPNGGTPDDSFFLEMGEINSANCGKQNTYQLKKAKSFRSKKADEQQRMFLTCLHSSFIMARN